MRANFDLILFKIQAKSLFSFYKI